MSPEMITVILTGIGTVATLLGVMLAMQRHSQAHNDKRFEQVDRRFEQVDRRFEQIDMQLRYVQEQITTLREDVVELKVSVARIEGPQPTLLRAR